MPIPTDTFWNMKRLNWAFAISAVLMFLATAWSILQDYERGWRTPQRQARTWEAALTLDKLNTDLTPDKQQQIDQLVSDITRIETEILAGNERYKQLERDVKRLDSDRETIEFEVNTLKSNVAVMESNLQDARTSGDAARAQSILREMAKPAAILAEESEKLANKKEELQARRDEMKQLGDELDKKLSEKNRLMGDAELLQKKLKALDPDTLPARFSALMRDFPLLGFVNPSERVQQVVLPHVQTDVAFMKITTVDRCVTCHVNIQNKDFTVENVLAYLESEAAKAQGLKLPAVAGGKAADAVATVAAPGPVAMVDFWHGWARQLGPDVIRKNAARIRTVTNSIGKTATVTYNGKPVAGFTFDPNLDDPKARQIASTQPAATTRPYLADPDAQNDILLALIGAWYRFAPSTDAQKPATLKHQFGKATVEINADQKTADSIRAAAMRYAEELRNGLKSALEKDTWRLLEDRYRYAMVDVVNAERARQGLAKLDASPVLLAHSKRDLYASQDSPHPMDAEGSRIGVGCTVCHDGSGQETDFVLAAHVARPIWVDAKTGEPVVATQLVNPPHEHHAEDLSDMLAAVLPHSELVSSVVPNLHLGAPHGEAADEAEQSLDRDALLRTPPPDQTKPIDYVDPITGKRSQAISQAQYWRQKYEPISAQSFYTTYHYWDWPMRTPQYIQANCVRCHTDVYDIKNEAPIIYEGRQLFTNLGCVNCHQMDSIKPEDVPTGADKQLVMANGRVKVGTDLRHVTSKLSPQFINTWIWSPKAFRPTTKMPHFFMLENNSSDEEIRRTRQESRAISEYLVRTATPLTGNRQIPPEAKGSIEAGQQLFNTLGCLACHNNLNDTTSEKRDGKPITVGEKWITTDLVKNPKFVAEVTIKLGKTPQAPDLLKQARAVFDSMDYNQRQLYVQQHLSEPAAEAARLPHNAAPTLPKYPDGSPRPIFVQIGPELSGVGTKLTAGRTVEQAREWILNWLKEPRHYSQYTIMPRLRLSDQEAMDLAEYLLAQKRTNFDPKDEWRAILTPPDTVKLIEMTSFFLRSRYSVLKAYEKADDPAELRKLVVEALKDLDAEQSAEILRQIESEPNPSDSMRMMFLGQKLIAHYGCMSCHAINGTQNITSPCTNLSDWGQKGIDKLDFGYLDHHKLAGLPATSKIPMVNGLSARSTHLLDPQLDAHATASADPHAGGSIGGMSRDLEVGWPHIGHNRVDWITHKLRNTRVYDRGKVLLEPETKKRENGLLESPGKPYDKLKMPTFFLNEEQVHALVTFVISNRDRLISDTLTSRAANEHARLIARGRELTERYNCVSCHQVELAVPQIQQYAKPEEVTELWPPSLRGQGNKVQHSWLFNFFKNVEPLRPLILKLIRMPSFYATDDEFRAIIAYFNVISQKESRWLSRQIDPIHKQIETELKTSKSTTQPSEGWPADADWWTRTDLAPSAEALRNWALVHGLVKEIELDPTKNTKDQINRTYKTILFKARFVKALYDSPYPFVEAGRPEWGSLPKDETEKKFKLGEQLFYEMQCLKCHVLGDPNIEGAQKNPTAPSLSLAYQRLQRRWVRDWMQEPAIIQLNTKMPPFFTGLDPLQGIYLVHGRPWPKSQGVSEEEVRRVESKFGSTVQEQTKLVLDFLYEAGARNYTGIQPPGAEQSATPPAPSPTQPATQESTTQPAATRPS